MSLSMLSSKSYENTNTDYGDCTIIIYQGKALVYDCGSIEHANKVIDILDVNNIKKADCVLSHNDDDHYKGFRHLIDSGRVNCFYTIDVNKYKKAILEVINDGRRNINGISDQIDEIYDNLSELSELIAIRDIYEYKAYLPNFIKFTGPKKDYFIQTAATGLDSRDSDKVDKTSFTNASSIQLEVDLGITKILLTGDCAINAIPNNIDLSKFDFIQIPHHGNEDMADELFNRVGRNNDIVYLVSDNKGNAKGGSDSLISKKYKYHKAKNTRDETIKINDDSTTKKSYIPRASLGLWYT